MQPLGFPFLGKLFSGLDTPFNIGKLFQDWASEKAQSEGLTGHHQMPAEEQRSGGMRSGAHGGLMCPLEKGVRGIETSHQMPGRSWRAGKPLRG